MLYCEIELREELARSDLEVGSSRSRIELVLISITLHVLDILDLVILALFYDLGGTRLSDFQVQLNIHPISGWSRGWYDDLLSRQTSGDHPIDFGFLLGIVAVR